MELDDLLPTNDANYQPPEEVGDLFLRGGAAWELADVFKWPNGSNESFAAGWQAGLFEIALKIGRAFGMPVRTSHLDDFVHRAKSYGRTCTIGDTNLGNTTLITVSPHPSWEEVKAELE